MYESKVILPDDIQRIVRNFVLKRVIPFVSIEIIVISYILILGEESFKIVDRTPRILIYLALVILPLFIFGMSKLIDRSWSGEIVKINVEAGYESSGRHLFNANYLILTIKRDDGKIIDCTVNSFNTGSWIPTSASSDFAHGKAESLKMITLLAIKCIIITEYRIC